MPTRRMTLMSADATPSIQYERQAYCQYLKTRKEREERERSEVEEKSMRADINSSEKIAEVAFTNSSEHTR
jgi:hypothetical protein